MTPLSYSGLHSWFLAWGMTGEALYDPVALAEIALLAEVIIAATCSPGRLAPAALDAALGLRSYAVNA